MRFHPEGPSIPDILLERCDAGRVVFLCGAGVSVPSGMPNFVDLTQYVIEFFDPPANSEIMTAFRPWLDGQSAANVPLDQIFNLLHLEYGKDHLDTLGEQGLSRLVDGYLQHDHAQGGNPRCPLAFMAIDVALREPRVRHSYTRTFSGFVERLQAALPGDTGTREKALQLAVTLIGGVALARALDDAELSEELLAACRDHSQALLEES